MSTHNNKGLTLLEVLVSVLIISIIAAGVFSAFIGSKAIFNRARHRLQAFNFAREAMDKMRSNYKYIDIQEDMDIGPIVRGEEMQGLDTVLIYNVSEPEHGGYKIVDVTVRWNEPEL